MPSENVPSDPVEKGDSPSLINTTFLGYYGLNEQPFGLTPDPSFLYLTPSHREALAALLCGIETGRGFAALIAQPGMGKTTLLFRLLERYRGSARTAFLFRTQCDSGEFLSYLLSDLGISPNGQSAVAMQEKLSEILLGEAAAGRRVLVFIDEAHNLNESVLETVRLMSDFERPDAKLIQIVLAGQPSLADKLVAPALRQRVSVRARLNPLTTEEVTHYIDHRLRVAGYAGHSLFTPEAQLLLAERSGGIPRDINNLCFHSLMTGFALSLKVIDTHIIQEVCASLDLQEAPKEPGSTAADLVQDRVTGAGPSDAPFPARDDSGPSGEISARILESQRIDHIQDASSRALEALTGELDEKIKKALEDGSCRVVEEARKRLENEVSAALGAFSKGTSDRLRILEEEQLRPCLDRFQAEGTEQVQSQVSNLKAALEPYLELKALIDKIEPLLNDGGLINRLAQACEGAKNACQRADVAVNNIALSAETAMKKLSAAYEEMQSNGGRTVDELRESLDEALIHSTEQLRRQAEETAERVSTQLSALQSSLIDDTNKQLAMMTPSALDSLTQQAQAITEECRSQLRQALTDSVLSGTRQLEVSRRQVEELLPQSLAGLHAEITEQFQKQVDGVQDSVLEFRRELRMMADKIEPLLAGAALVHGQDQDDMQNTEAAMSQISLAVKTAMDSLHTLEHQLVVNSAAAMEALRKAADEMTASLARRLERQADESATRIKQELREMNARSTDEANERIAAVTQASLQSLTHDAESITEEWRGRLREAINEAALANVQQLEAGHEGPNRQRGPIPRSVEMFPSASPSDRSWPTRFYVTPTTVEAALNSTLRAAVWLLPITPVVLFVVLSIRPVTQLRSEPPAEFLGQGHEEEHLARAYWQSAVRDVQPKHQFGTSLPEEPPVEFKAEGADLQTVNRKSDADTRSRYWQRLRQVWAQPQSWQKSYVWDTDWIDAAFAFLEQAGRKIVGSAR